MIRLPSIPGRSAFRRTLAAAWWLLAASGAWAQLPGGLPRAAEPATVDLGRVPPPQALAPAADSGRVLSPEAFYGWVAAHHPVARQGALLQEQARARLLEARGGFDPKLAAGWSVKDFDDKSYWDLRGAELKVPTWLGLELKADYGFAEGDFLNPERSVPADGLVGVGASANLLRGLVTDRRRTDLRQARAFGQQAEAERDALLVDLMLDAAEAYWSWSAARARVELALLVQALTREQLRITVAQFGAGNRAAIDTLEARIRLDKRSAELIEAALDLENARWMASAFLWTEDGRPVALAEDVLPVRPDRDLPAAPGLDGVLARADALPLSHPVLRAGSAKWAILDAERRFKVQNALPALRGSYQWLSPAAPFGENLQDRLTADYKWGVELELPLFFRKEIGAARAARWKLEQLNWELARKTVDLQVKLRQSWNAWEANGRLVAAYDRIAEDSRVLYEAERTRFAIGESTLFLVNSRENGFLDARLKRLDTRAKQHVLAAKWRWSAGLMPDTQAP